MPHPDPILTASLFCDGLLDEAVHGAVAPFRDALRTAAPGWRGGTWMVRYTRGGMHLKLRVHGPGAPAPLAGRLLEESAARFFATLPPRDPQAPRASRPELPAIDEDDEAPGDRPDRALLFTRWRRSHVNLGPPAFLGDDRYVGHITACLAAGGAIVLDALEPGMAVSRRLGVLRRAVLAGVAAAGFGEEERGAYLAYHRDWLLRFLLSSRAKEEEALETFDGQAARMGPALEQLRRDAAAAGDPAERGAWEEAAAALAGYLARFRGDPAYHVDPFTDDPVFPALFKAFHGLANQLGVDMRNEAFVHHLVLRAAEAVPAGAGA
jgi:hypothetical protein